MKTTTLFLVVTLSLTVLVLAILWQTPRKQKATKEPFVAELEQAGIGIGAAVGIIVLLVLLFFVFYNVPKEPNYVRRRFTYYNLE